MMIADATITKAVYRVKRGVRATIVQTKASHTIPNITNRMIIEVFI
jgi:hypothetical protein